jgi:hypothetical protein
LQNDLFQAAETAARLGEMVQPVIRPPPALSGNCQRKRLPILSDS